MSSVAWGFEGEDGGEGFEEAAMNGGRGFAVKLLIDDGLDECFEGGLGAGYAHSEGAGALDELAEFGIGGREVGYSFCRVIAGRTRTVEGTRHPLTVSQASKIVLLVFLLVMGNSD